MSLNTIFHHRFELAHTKFGTSGLGSLRSEWYVLEHLDCRKYIGGAIGLLACASVALMHGHGQLMHLSSRLFVSDNQVISTGTA